MALPQKFVLLVLIKELMAMGKTIEEMARLLHYKPDHPVFVGMMQEAHNYQPVTFQMPGKRGRKPVLHTVIDQSPAPKKQKTEKVIAEAKEPRKYGKKEKGPEVPQYKEAVSLPGIGSAGKQKGEYSNADHSLSFYEKKYANV